MTGSAPQPSWSSSQSGAPSVVVLSNQASLRAGGSPHLGGGGRRGTQAQGAYVWIVMSLLIASTTLAVYDLYVLTSALAGGG